MAFATPQMGDLRRYIQRDLRGWKPKVSRTGNPEAERAEPPITFRASGTDGLFRFAADDREPVQSSEEESQLRSIRDPELLER